MATLSYPLHFLHDIENMTPVQRADRCDELIAWAKRYADGNANPKWVKHHMFELARLAEMMRGKPSGIHQAN
ncbi:hypothetical protein O4H48_13905 [Rhodobacteraceae bacterium G21628-S1]|nr:hypothetical protein [Rhodobacteraceae bacterium G21628-S1]